MPHWDEFARETGIAVPKDSYSASEVAEHQLNWQALIDEFGLPIAQRAYHSHVMALQGALHRYWKAQARSEQSKTPHDVRCTQIASDRLATLMDSLPGIIADVRNRCERIQQKEQERAAAPLSGLFASSEPKP